MTDIKLLELQPEKITDSNIIFSDNPNCCEGMILVYADWCPHCVDFKPTYNYLTRLFDDLDKGGKVKLNNNKVIIGNKSQVPKLWAMNIDNHKNNPKGKNLEFVQGFPTILIVRDINGKEGKIETFKGNRSIPNILEKFKTTLGMKN